MSVISDIFSRVTTGIQTQLTSISTLMVKVKNFGNRAAAYAQQKIQTLAQNLTRDPKAKEDYVGGKESEVWKERLKNTKDFH